VGLCFAVAGGWLALGMFEEEPPATTAAQIVVQFPDSASGVAGSDAGIAAVTEPAISDDGASATSAVPASSGVDPTWLRTTAAATGIPERALDAYATATLRLSTDQPGCGLGWNTLAAIGAIESGHGSHGGAVLGDDGVARPPILGPRLDGSRFMRIADSDGGALDGDAEVDRAVGPFQFIPQTWARWGSDGDGDGVADPHDMTDAALSAGRYLCSYGDLSGVDGWRRAVFAYNHDDAYVDGVAARAQEFGGLAR
jgi:membrane-bound lytic murein transglycosylase B